MIYNTKLLHLNNTHVFRSFVNTKNTAQKWLNKMEVFAETETTITKIAQYKTRVKYKDLEQNHPDFSLYTNVFDISDVIICRNKIFLK